jgi:hypothetical protein
MRQPLSIRPRRLPVAALLATLLPAALAAQAQAPRAENALAAAEAQYYRIETIPIPEGISLEVGGMAPLIGIWNPPPERLPEVCHGQSAVLLRVAAMTPKLDVAVTTNGRRVDIDVRNLGYLATYFIPSARKSPVAEPLYLELAAEDGARLAAGEPTRHLLGHLDGWGRGHLNPGQSILLPRSGGFRPDRRCATRLPRAMSCFEQQGAHSKPATTLPRERSRARRVPTGGRGTRRVHQ